MQLAGETITNPLTNRAGAATGGLLRYQFRHLLALLLLMLAIRVAIAVWPDMLQGSFWGLNSRIWLWLAIAIPVLHQVYVMLTWRLELYHRSLTRRLGLQRAFRLYAIGFSLLFGGRFLFILLLAISNRNTWQVDPAIAYGLALLITPPVLYLAYSVKTYFTVERAFGMDHFDPNYREPFVKQGIFRYTDNGMYIFGLLALYLPGLLLFSKAALLVALFNHLYIWVHYYCTERPDMITIYGKTP